MLECGVGLVDMGRRLAVQALMGPAMVVVGKIRVELVKQVLAVVGRVEVNVLPLNGAPEALDEGVVGGAAPPPTASISTSNCTPTSLITITTTPTKP